MDVRKSMEMGARQMAVYQAIDVARWFLGRNDIAYNTRGGEKLTLLKLMKLLYYAEGCSLALGNRSLFTEEILAWAHGPAVLEVFQHYPDPDNLAFSERDEGDMASVRKIGTNDWDQKVLENVVEGFGQYAAWKLRSMTREVDPWTEASSDGRHLGGVISRETMKRFFLGNYVTD